jgi:hypothetical protein
LNFFSEHRWLLALGRNPKNEQTKTPPMNPKKKTVSATTPVYVKDRKPKRNLTDLQK